MRKITITTALGTCLALAACKKSDAAASEAKTEAKTETGCPEDYAKVEKYRFCLKLPPGAKPLEVDEMEEGRTEVRWMRPQGGVWIVEVFEGEDPYDPEITKTWGIVNDATVEHGEFLGGKGRWAIMKRPDRPEPSMTVAVKGPKYSYRCMSSTSDAQVHFDMCKTIRPIP